MMSSAWDGRNSGSSACDSPLAVVFGVRLNGVSSIVFLSWPATLMVAVCALPGVAMHWLSVFAVPQLVVLAARKPAIP